MFGPRRNSRSASGSACYACDLPSQLARLRTPYWLGDSAVRLHALTSLIAQGRQLLPQAVHDARDQELTWAQISELLGTTAATAARRYRNQP